MQLNSLDDVCIVISLSIYFWDGYGRGDVMGVSGRTQKWMERRRGPLQKWAKAPKFGKPVKCGNGGIFGVLVPYVLVYLFRRVRGNVACERRSLTETFWDAKSDEVCVRIPARQSCDE